MMSLFCDVVIAMHWRNCCAIRKWINIMSYHIISYHIKINRWQWWRWCPLRTAIVIDSNSSGATLLGRSVGWRTVGAINGDKSSLKTDAEVSCLTQLIFISIVITVSAVNAPPSGEVRARSPRDRAEINCVIRRRWHPPVINHALGLHICAYAKATGDGEERPLSASRKN